MNALLFPLLIVLLGGFMYMTMRKQKKRMNEMQQMQESVGTGTRVALTSGLFGTVIDATSSEFVDVEIATGIVTRWNRQAIMRVIPTEDAAATYPGYVPAPVDDGFDTLDGELADTTDSDSVLGDPMTGDDTSSAEHTDEGSDEPSDSEK